MTTDPIRWTEEDDRELERQLQRRVAVMERCSSCHARIEHDDEYGLCRQCSSYLCPACFTASGLCTWCQEEER